MNSDSELTIRRLWANPILEEPLNVEDGHASVPDAPGIGLSWDEEAVRRYSVE
jgi:mandelate racemase